MKGIRVLLQVQSGRGSVLGGDLVQCLKTKEYLKRLGIKADLSFELRPNVGQYDIVHVFHTDANSYESYIRYRNAKEQEKPVVISPIYWNMDEYAKRGVFGIKNKLYYLLPDGALRRILSILYNRNLAEINHFRSKDALSLDLRRLKAKMLNSCDLILPNSKMEAKLVVRDFGISDVEKISIVPNAADKFFFYSDPHAFVSRYHLQDFVLCVGRMEDRKNQLSLIRALRNTSLKLVLIGKSQRACDLAYYEKCRKEGGVNVMFISGMEHEALSSAYAAAKVHVLPSWYETPGLASLEAGLAGCNIVTTDRGSTREYFKQYALYCDPSDTKSIHKAVVEAFEASKSSELSQHILENYTWEKTADKTLRAYKKVLEK